MFHTDDNRIVAIDGWPDAVSTAEAQRQTTEPVYGSCGNGHVGPANETCTQDGCGRMFR